MRTRLYNEQIDFQIFYEWWVTQTRGMPPPPQSMLPVLGFVTEHTEYGPLAMVFAYVDSGKPDATACLAFHVSCPGKVYGALTHAALIKVVRDAKDYLIAEKFVRFIMATTDVKAVVHSLTENGFLPGSEGTLTDFVYVRGGG